MKNNRKLLAWLLPLLTVSLLIAGFFLLRYYNDPRNKVIVFEEESKTIAVPGYEVLELTADKKRQTLCLPNPESNTCYFEISLFLEDETLLWQSSLIEPGKTSKPMVLKQRLSEGTYPAILRYNSFKTDGSLAALNGAETKVTLRVK